MNYEIQQALNEIMEIPPIYRRDFIVNYLRRNMSKEDARQFLFKKTKADFLQKMVAEGYISREDVLEKIGKERIEQYFHILSKIS
ncbi:MAG: hypothetical protein BHV78_04545 [Bacteroides sp. CAG:1060_57_27]|nr:MAG: hypothetical protein BHV78_04545 [Bacteroides sp. CAG:1060_57_27]